jgi:hypothetical protein
VRLETVPVTGPLADPDRLAPERRLPPITCCPYPIMKNSAMVRSAENDSTQPVIRRRGLPRLAGGQPFDDPSREPVVALDLEPRSTDLLNGAAQEVLAAQRDRHQLEDALAGPQHPE